MAIALRRAMAVVYVGALFLSRASTDPGRETFLRRKGSGGRADFRNDLGRKSLLSCLVSGLRSCCLDPVAESSEFANHSCGALLLRPFSDSRTTFFVTDSLVQDEPDQSTLSMGNRPDGLIMSQAQNRTAIDNLEEASFSHYRSVGSLVE